MHDKKSAELHLFIVYLKSGLIRTFEPIFPMEAILAHLAVGFFQQAELQERRVGKIFLAGVGGRMVGSYLPKTSVSFLLKLSTASANTPIAIALLIGGYLLFVFI